MPFIFAFLGILLVVIGARGQAAAAGQLLASEFTGPNSFATWFLAIMLLGFAGYWRPARPLANGMLGLVMLGLILAYGSGSKGFFANLEEAFTNTKATPSNKVTPNQPNATASVTAPNTSAVSTSYPYPNFGIPT